MISHDLFMTWQRYHMEFKMLKLTEMSHQRKRLVKALIVKDLDGSVRRAAMESNAAANADVSAGGLHAFALAGWVCSTRTRRSWRSSRTHCRWPRTTTPR